MPPLSAVFEFQERVCRICVWQNLKDAHVLRSVLHVPLAKAALDAGESGVEASVQANAAAIRQALKSADLKLREGSALIPKQWVTLRIVTLPSADPAELSEMARFEAERHIPFHAERHVVSHHVLRVEGIQGSQVLIAAVDGPPAVEITSTLEAAGIQLTALDVSTAALANALLYSGRWDPETDPTVCQIDVGLEAIDMTILHDGIPIFARSIALGIDRVVASLLPGEVAENLSPGDIRGLDLLQMRDSDRGEESQDDSSSAASAARHRLWHERLVHEIRQTFEFARRQFDCHPLSKIFLSGPGADLGGLERILRTSLGVEPVKIDPFDRPDASRTGGRTGEPQALGIDSNAGAWMDAPWALASAAGALLRETWGQAIRIDLLPPSYVSKRIGSRRRRSLLTTAGLAAALAISLWVLAYQTIERRQNLLEFYADRIERNKPRVAEIAYRQTVVKILKENSSRKDSALSILNTLSGWDDLFDESDMKVSIGRFDYDVGKGQGSLVISCRARGYPELFQFMQKLYETGYFAGQPTRDDPRFETVPHMRSVQVLSCKVRCRFLSEGSRTQRR
ncbi:pilus assembly protein PilM [Candidatus Sumerlaeota bacterium]|nr:pilus assembly protein PilM [Candidatus Sumerlaeota bacterium]